MRAFMNFASTAVLLLAGSACLIWLGWGAHILLGDRPAPIIVHDQAMGPFQLPPSGLKGCIELTKACYRRERQNEAKK